MKVWVYSGVGGSGAEQCRFGGELYIVIFYSCWHTPLWYIFRKGMNNYVSSDGWRGASRSRFGISLGNRRGVLCKGNFNNI